jgi:hypothetical protein
MKLRCEHVLLLGLALVPAEAGRGVTLPQVESRARPVLRVLAIGIDRYTAGYRLNYAMKDARVVARKLESCGCSVFERVDVRLLTDGQADRLAIFDGMEWLRRESAPEDVSIIYYSGHGGNDPPIGFYWAPARYNDRFWRQTMVSGEELRRETASIPGRVVLLMETCYCGALLQQGSLGERVAVLGATQVKEETRGGNRFRRSHFTRAFIEGLGGLADANDDGVVDLGELAQYMDRRIGQIRTDGKQHMLSRVPDAMIRLALTRP